MKKFRVVYLLLILCLVLVMFVGCTNNGPSQSGTDGGNNSQLVDEGDFNDPFDE